MIKCSAATPCNAQQLLAMSQAGSMLTDSMRSIVSNQQLPTFVSSVGLSTIQSVVGGIEGVVGKSLGELQSAAGVSDEQLGMITSIGSRIVTLLTGAGDADPYDTMKELAGLVVEIGTDVATELASKAAGVIPIAGAILSVVIDLVRYLVAEIFGEPPHVLADAAAAERARQEMCASVVSRATVVPTGPAGALPCDLFNGVAIGPWRMTPAGAVLIRGSEDNPGIPGATRRAIKNLRLLIQGSSLTQTNGLDPFTGKVVYRIPGVSTDGGQSLWPIYMDTLLWYRQLGALSNDQLFNRTYNSPVRECAREYTPYGVAVVEQWREQKQRIDTGTGYGLWDPKKMQLTPSTLAAIKLGSAFYAGKEAGIKYTVKQAVGGKIALVGPGGVARSFSSRLASSGAPAKSSYVVPVVLAGIGGYGLYRWLR